MDGRRVENPLIVFFTVQNPGARTHALSQTRIDHATVSRSQIASIDDRIPITARRPRCFIAWIIYITADLKFKLIEPLRTLFKDEVRQVGLQLGLPEAIIWRQPFPGPGLGIRIIGEVTAERLEILREADAIAREELKAAGLDREIWQCPVVLLAEVRSVGVQGDGRTYGHPIVLRPVSSEDAMTADWSRVPYEVLAKISTRITNEVREVNRVTLDITSKPPATIEWE